MNIIFETLEVQNFKSIGDLVYINYNDFNGLNFVIGNNLDNPGSKNGCGKSVILVDCILFALYGKTVKSISNQYLKNRYYDKKAETFVKLTFIVNNIRYKSECYCNKASLKMLLYIENKNEDSGWKDITQSSIIKTKQYIQDEILKCSYDVFKTAIIISAADCLNFYENMSKAQKRDYIENIFNLDCFGIMLDNIRVDINNTKKEISFINSEIIKTAQQLSNIETKFNEFNSENNTKKDNIKNEIVLNANLYKQKQNDFKKYENNSLQLQELNNQYKENLNQINSISNNINVLEKQNIKAESKIESINQFIDKIKDIKSGLCDNCSTIIDSKYDYNKQILSINALNNLINENLEKIKLYNIQNQDFLSKNDNINKKIIKLDMLDKEMTKLEYELSNLKSLLIRLKKEYNDLNTDNINPFNDLLIKTEKNLVDLKNQLNNMNISYKHLDILKSICSENGVKQTIIKDIVILLNSLIQKYLNEIGLECIVYFDESFDFKFLTVSGECEYNSFSSGEQQRIQIATVLAFRDLILNGKINSNILVIDEMLDKAIDSIGIKKIISILQKKSIDLNQALFIISHRSEITDENIFQHIIEVIKKNGLTSINII